MWKNISCIFTKIINILGIVISILILPYLISIGIDLTFVNVLFGLLLSISYFIFSLFGVLKTNDPDRRFNIFTLNKNWKSKMEKSFSENPSQISDLDEKSDSEIKRLKRNNKIDSILND